MTDIDMLNVVKEEDWLKYFKPSSISTILAEHVFEHLNESDTGAAIRNIYHFLRPGGIFRIAVPDGFHISAKYIDYVKPGGSGAGAADHKILYTYKTLSDA